MPVRLIAVVELPGDGADRSDAPAGPWWEHAEAWEAWYRQAHSRAGFQAIAFDALRPGCGLYPVSKLSDEDLARLVELHIGGHEESAVCALFGGFALAWRGATLLPQCCSTLEDLDSWLELLEDHDEAVWLGEGHPSPCALTRPEGDELLLNLEDLDGEAFAPPMPAVARLPLEETRQAIRKAQEEIAVLARRLAELSPSFGLDLPSLLL